MRYATKEHRLASARKRAGSAVGLFQRAAEELDAAAAVAAQVAVEAAEEANRLTDLRYAAEDESAIASTKAGKIRELFA